MTNCTCIVVLIAACSSRVATDQKYELYNHKAIHVASYMTITSATVIIYMHSLSL